jgi:PAS domain S-box-containing protein
MIATVMPIHRRRDDNTFWLNLAKSAGLLCTTIGLLVLIGWIQDIAAFKSIDPDWIAMKANTAFCFVLTGLALWLKASPPLHSSSRWRRTEKIFAGIPLLFGFLTLLEYLLHLNFGIDQWLYQEREILIGTLPPGRMAPATALCFILLGSALLLENRSSRQRWLIASLAVISGSLALSAGLIYLYDTNNSYGLAYPLQLAANTVLAFCLLAAGLLFAQPEHGVIAQFRRNDSGGAITRHLLPAILFLPILIGWLILNGERGGIYKPDFGMALAALAYVVILSTLVLWSARILSRTDAERARMNAIIAEDDMLLRTLLNTIPDMVWLKNTLGIYLACNPAFERFFGTKEAAIIGKSDYDFVPRELADFFRANDQAAITAGTPLVNEEWLTLADSGQRILAESTKTPMFDRSGKLQGVLGIARDITAQHLATEKLKTEKAKADRLLADTNQSKLALLSALEDSKAATQAKHLSEQRYAFLFDAIADAVFVNEILDDGTLSGCLEVNEAACQLSGYEHAELLGLSPLQLNAPDSGVKLPAVIERLRRDKSAVFEQTHRTKDGRNISVEIHSHLFMLNGRQAVISIMRDISERKLAEQHLRESEEQYRTLFQTMLNGFAYCRILYENNRPCDFVYLDVNAAFETKTGLKDVIGKRISTVIPGIHETDPQLLERYARVATSRIPEQFEIYVEALKMWFFVSVYSPKPEYFVAVFDVITERKQAEEMLRASEERYRTMIENSNDLIWALTAEGNFSFINQRAADLTGYAIDEWLGKSFAPLVLEEDRQKTFEIHRRVMAGEKIHYEVRGKKANGEILTLSVNASPILKNGKEIGTISFSSDITARKRAEEELHRLNSELEQRVQARTAQLAASNKELEAFSYSVSHDLRAPLRSITGFVELLRKQGYQSIDEKGRHYMDVISQSAVQMGQLIDDILTFSRIGRAEITLSRINLGQILKDVMNTLRPQFEQRQVEWKLHPLPEVMGERTMLTLVLQNLLSNALKFTQTRTTAMIEIGTLEQSPNETVCYVKDNGVGFDMRHADKLFGLFQRLHPQAQFAGTGVGLANVQRMIQRHGGRVWAEGKIDEGATIYFALPKKPEVAT